MINVYSKICHNINVGYIAKTTGFTAEQTIAVATDAVKEHGMGATVSEDKKTIAVSLIELSVNKRIAEKGKELEERTKKLQDFISHKVVEA